MPQVSKVAVGWSGLLDNLAECVKAWHPPPLNREIDYSRALASYLRESLPSDSHVETEYRHIGQTIDVYVRYSGFFSDDEALIEVKLRLNQKPEFDRRVGQVIGLEPGKHKILVVLMGDADVELVGRLRQRFRQHMTKRPLVASEPTFRIVEVPEATPAK
jgi:hypothetical protein